MAGEVYSKLITSKNPKVMNASSRNGLKIDRIIIHHNATTNKNTAMNTWFKAGRLTLRLTMKSHQPKLLAVWVSSTPLGTRVALVVQMYHGSLAQTNGLLELKI